MYERKTREALEIKKLNTINEKDKTFTVLNSLLELFVPIDKAMIILTDTLNNDLDDLNTRTKLTLTDIYTK